MLLHFTLLGRWTHFTEVGYYSTQFQLRKKVYYYYFYCILFLFLTLSFSLFSFSFFFIRLRRATGCWNEILLYWVVSKVSLKTFLWWAKQKGSLKKWRIWTWFHFWPITMEHNMWAKVSLIRFWLGSIGHLGKFWG